MPLSNIKLNLSAFAPLIDRTDRYLTGWQATLLNSMGRAVLVNAVLDSALIYVLSAMQLPQGTLDSIDKRRRAFLWSGESTTNGAHCLVAWEQTCLPKEQGGLGVKKKTCKFSTNACCRNTYTGFTTLGNPLGHSG